MQELTIIEKSVLELIPRGSERKVKVTELSKLIDLNEREVKAVIESLRTKGIPIVSVRGAEGGLFVAITEEEREIGLRAFRNQQQSMERTISYIEQADLANWQKQVI